MLTVKEFEKVCVKIWAARQALFLPRPRTPTKGVSKPQAKVTGEADPSRGTKVDEPTDTECSICLEKPIDISLSCGHGFCLLLAL